MNSFEKLFIARTLLSLNQKEAAEQAGIHPASLSILERGEKKFIPTEYLHFLHSKGIDINWIFSDSNSTSAVFRTDGKKQETNPDKSISQIYSEGSLQALLTGKEQPDTKVIIHKHNTVADHSLKEILEELRKLNSNLITAQSSIPQAYGN